MKVGLWTILKAAFNARPIGMFVPPNWIGVAAFGLLGALLHPAFFAIGAGLELGYLFLLVSNARFRRFVQASHNSKSIQDGQQKVRQLVADLEESDRKRYQVLERQCQSILQNQQIGQVSTDLLAQGEGLGRLIWIYLRLLTTRRHIHRVLRESADLEKGSEDIQFVRRRSRSDGAETGCILIQERIDRLASQIKDGSVPEEVRRSLTGQIEILQQRLASRKEALQKLEFLEAELTRIEEQVKLIREQASLTTDPTVVSQRIDQISASLGGTTQWIREQQKLYGQVEDLLDDPPMIPSPKSSASQAQ